MQHTLQQMQPAHSPRPTTRGSPPTPALAGLNTSTSTSILQLAATEEQQSNVNPDNTLQISTTVARPKRPQTPSNFRSPLKSGKGPEGPRNSSFMVHLDPSPVWKKNIFSIQVLQCNIEGPISIHWDATPICTQRNMGVRRICALPQGELVVWHNQKTWKNHCRL